jgi:hypothetical protein
VVFLSVLVMALLANLLVSWTRRVPIGLAYVGLFGAIGLNVFLPLREFAGADFLVRVLLVGTITALPLFFSGIVFAYSFSRTDDPAHALGSNLLGGLFGGAIEYLSMMMGLQFLFLLVTAFYGMSLLTLKGRTPAPAGDVLQSTSKPALSEVLAGQRS